MTLAVRLPARSLSIPQGADRQAPVTGPSVPKGSQEERGLAMILFAAIGIVQWLRFLQQSGLSSGSAPLGVINTAVTRGRMEFHSRGGGGTSPQGPIPKKSKQD